jgi:hypothetical protein
LYWAQLGSLFDVEEINITPELFVNDLDEERADVEGGADGMAELGDNLQPASIKLYPLMHATQIPVFRL